MEPVERVRETLDRLGLPATVVEYPVTTGTAREAAAAVGCEPGQIVKTLLFLADGRPALVLVAGDRQADTAAIASILGVGRKKLKMGTPAEVAAHTGFEVGGVAPVGGRGAFDVLADESLKRFETVWAAAGTANAVFEAPTEALARVSGAQWGAITKVPG